MGPDSSLTPDFIQAQTFTTAFRGYDAAEVKTFLGRVATELRAWRERAEGLESAWHSAEERAARPPVLDEDTLMAAVGEETASILRSARSAAADMRSKAADDAERTLAESQAEATRLREEANVALAHATSEAAEVSARALADARRAAAEILERAQAEADAIRANADKERQLTIEGATTTRDRILEDLSRRRRVATVQIEQLRAGRERLIESYAMVRRTLEEVQSELSRADTEARSAADDMGRRLRDQPEVELTEASRIPDEILAEALPESEEPPGTETETETETETDTDTDTDTDALADTDGGAPASAVDELFARIRGSEPPAGEPTAGEPTAGVEMVAEPEPVASEPGVEHPDPAPEPAPEPAPGAGSPGGDDARAVIDEPAEGYRSNDDEALLQERESSIVDLEVTLTRRLKRALQDEQNDVLDRLRNLKGAPGSDALLTPVEDQIARYADAGRPLLADAARAGWAFTERALGAEGGRDADVDVTDLAEEAGTAIVSTLRRRLEAAIDVGSAEDPQVLVESLGAAYREWKTQRIERLAGDALAAAFSRGTWQAAPDATLLRWIVEDADGPCPDCDDDALAGRIPKGEAFPTGQNHPPAHSGCRCLLVPAPAPAG